MKLNNFQRFVKLVLNLVHNPDLIAPYVKHNIFNKKFPIDLNLPWWSYRSIHFVDNIVLGKKIFEYGSGGSTVRYASKASKITCVENDMEWGNILLEKLKQLNIANVSVQLLPFDFKNPKQFHKSEYLIAASQDDYDIYILDGQDHTFKERITCFRYVEPRMKEGNIIILDDFWRYEQLLKSNSAKQVKVFESVGPCRYGVTSTAVFFY